MLIKLLFLILLFGLVSSFSIMLTGNRAFLSQEINLKSITSLLFDWHFIVSMVLAVMSRFVFIWINHYLLSLPNLARNSTTITALITATSYIFIIMVNYFFLREQIGGIQLIGVIFIIAGVVLVMS